jgi:hypothetical protein
MLSSTNESDILRLRITERSCGEVRNCMCTPARLMRMSWLNLFCNDHYYDKTSTCKTYLHLRHIDIGIGIGIGWVNQANKSVIALL